MEKTRRTPPNQLPQPACSKSLVVKSDYIPPAGFEQRARHVKFRRCSFQLLLPGTKPSVTVSSYSRDVIQAYRREDKHAWRGPARAFVNTDSPQIPNAVLNLAEPPSSEPCQPCGTPDSPAEASDEDTTNAVYSSSETPKLRCRCLL
jgi:hypothetical protein